MGTRVGTRTEREDTRGDVDGLWGQGRSTGTRTRTWTEHGATCRDVGMRGHVWGQVWGGKATGGRKDTDTST